MQDEKDKRRHRRKLAGGINEVPMQAEGIQDRKNNTTRFLVVARRSLPKRRT